MNIETDPILMILFSLIEHFNISQDDPENTEPEPIGTRSDQKALKKKKQRVKQSPTSCQFHNRVRTDCKKSAYLPARTGSELCQNLELVRT